MQEQPQEEKILQRMRTPDGTILVSSYRHCSVSHTDKNGEVYTLDGGLAYVRCSANKEPMVDVSLYTTTCHSILREHITWGSYGKEGRDPLTFFPVKDLSTEHIEAILRTQNIVQALTDIFNNELIYRNKK